MAVFVGKFSVKGYRLGMVAAAAVVGAALSTWASLYGVQYLPRWWGKAV